jgi:flavin-dependent dehydrogenase
MKVSGLGPLPDGGTAVVIGGGPGGTATAIALKQGAQAMGRDARVVLVEGKRFAGEQHYNQCAGVLSPPISELVEQELRISFPKHLSRGEITGYVLHTARRQIVLDGEAEPSTALRRVQFDAYMLDAARKRDVEVIPARATGVEFHAERVIVYTENLPLEADVVVGAFGLDEGMAARFARAVDYRSPPVLNTLVTKYHPGQAAMEAFGPRIHAFLPSTPHIEFGAITPKGNHLTINIGGVGVDAEQMEAFLNLPEVQGALPDLENAGRFDSKDLTYFGGRFPRGQARNYAGDRFVMVGDAAGLVRAFKGKGVTSAIQTGVRAAQVILHEGISASAFKAYFAANRDITDDISYGQAMRRFTILSSRVGLMDIAIAAAEGDAKLRRALFDAVSAHRSYRDVARLAFSPRSFLVVATTPLRRLRPKRDIVPPDRLSDTIQKEA